MNRLPLRATRRTMALAIQILGVQITFAAFVFVDIILAGSSSPSNLAVIGLGFSIYIAVLVAPLGFVISIAPTLSFLTAEGKVQEVTSTLWHGLYLVSAIGLLLCATGVACHSFSGIAGLGAEEIAQLHRYILFAAVGAPAALIFRFFFVVATTQGRTQVALLINVLALAAKTGLTLVLVTGQGTNGEGLGPSGCALATAIANWMAVGVAGFAYLSPLGKFPQQLKSKPVRLSPKVSLAIMRGGLAVATLQGIEAGSVAAMGLLATPFGLAIGAAHQGAMNVAGLSFMIPSAIGLASATLISEALGRGALGQAERFLWSGFYIALSISIGMLCGIILFRDPIASVYSRDAVTSGLMSGLLVFVAVAQVPDMIGMWLMLVLRSFKSFAAPIYLAIVCRGLIGLGLGGLASRIPGHGGVDVLWMFLIVGLVVSVAGLALVLRANVRAARDSFDEARIEHLK